MTEQITPIDEESRLPLPLAPFYEPLSVTGPNTDWHHHFHPRRSPLLQDLGGQAVRNVRLQLADYRVHHIEYHGIYGGPPLPVSEEQQFRTVILATAGYIPNQAIYFHNKRPSIMTLSAEQRLHLQTSGELRFGNTALVRNFIQHYVLGQHWAAVNINESTVEEFIATSDLQRRRDLGHTLLALITEHASEPLSDTYNRARRQRQLLPGLANNVQRFTKSKLGPLRARESLIDKLHDKLVA